MLDIQLSDELSFEIFGQGEVKSTILFTTAYDEYVFKAFKFNSVNYLLKPIDEEELKFTIQKFQNYIGNINVIQHLFKGNQGKKYKKRFSVKVGSNIKL